MSAVESRELLTYLHRNSGNLKIHREQQRTKRGHHRIPQMKLHDIICAIKSGFILTVTESEPSSKNSN